MRLADAKLSNSLFYLKTSHFLQRLATSFISSEKKKNWSCSRYQTHMLSSCYYRKKTNWSKHVERIIKTIQLGKSDARNVIEHLKELSEKFAATFVIASALLPVPKDSATQFARPTKNNMTQTADRARKQINVNMPHM